MGTLVNVVALSREKFDAIEFDAAYTGDHQAAAEQMSALAKDGTATESMPRAEALVRAGEQWLLAGDPETAAANFRLALAGGGPVDSDPRVPLCRALFLLGRDAEAQALIEDLKSETVTDPRTCSMITELLIEQANLAGALEWATAGVELILSGGSGPSGSGPSGSGVSPDDRAPGGTVAPRADAAGGSGAAAGQSDLLDLLRIRYRIRNDLRLPEDEYDRMLNA